MNLRRLTLFGFFAASAAVAVACEPPPPFSLRVPAGDFVFLISAEPVRPVARETITFKVLVRDIKTGQPIEGGEGRIFATSKDGAQTYDGLEPGPEVGAYYGKLRFVTSGDWAMAVQFRRDSTQPLARGDFQQSVWPSKSAY